MIAGKYPKEMLQKQHIGVEWGWFLALGVILLVFGFVACLNLALATVASTLFIGFMVLFGGIVQIVHAFNVTRWGSFFLWLLAGILYVAAGIVCFFRPLEAAFIITLILALVLIAAGVIRIIIGFKARGIRGSGWIVFAGVITALLGILILIGWPINALWVLGIFLAIDLIFQGWGWIAFAIGLKTLEK